MILSSNISSDKVEINLPYAVNTIAAGSIDAYKDSILLSNFNVELTVTCHTDGRMTASAQINGSSISANTPDNPSLAQQVYFSPVHTKPNVENTSPDILSKELELNEIRSYYDSNLKNVEAVYTTNLISSWSITVNGETTSNDNTLNNTTTLSNYARFKKIDNPDLVIGSKNIFDEGEVIIAGIAPYSIAIPDYLDNLVELIPNSSIYALLKQTS